MIPINSDVERLIDSFSYENTMEYIKVAEEMKYCHLTTKQKEVEISPIRNSKVDPKQNRNSKCLCGSRLKYKNCCELKNKYVFI